MVFLVAARIQLSKCRNSLGSEKLGVKELTTRVFGGVMQKCRAQHSIGQRSAALVLCHSNGNLRAIQDYLAGWVMTKSPSCDGRLRRPPPTTIICQPATPEMQADAVSNLIPASTFSHIM